MTALIAFILSNPTILAIIGGIVAALGFGYQQRRAGRKVERAKQAERDIKAKDDLLEMHREATQHEKDAARHSDAEARRKALQWAKRQSFLQD